MTASTGGPSVEDPDERERRPVGKRARRASAGGRELGNTEEKPAPASVNTAVGLWMVALVCGVISVASSENALGFVGLALWTGLVFAMWFGRGWARHVLTGLGALSVVLNVVLFVSYADDGLPPWVVLLAVAQVSAVIGAIVQQYSAQSGQFFVRSTVDDDGD